MKSVVYLFICLFVCSCVNDIKRCAIECSIYDRITKKPIKDVQIIQKLDETYTVVTTTSKTGYFKLNKLTELKFGMSSRNLANKYFLKKEGYLVDTIISYGGLNDVDKRDSVFMRKN